MSRSDAERAVLAGRVSLDEKVVRDPERACHPDQHRITVDGRPLKPVRKVYLVQNKPRGRITTAADPQGRPTVYDLLPPGVGNVQAVGRLDADTTGLIIFTNDTEFAARITEAGEVPKVYRAVLKGRIGPEEAHRFETGVILDGKPTLPARCTIIEAGEESTRVEVEITEGRNRQVRRMWDIIGHPVLRLERVRIGPVEIGSLEPGRMRPLTEFERVVLSGVGRPDRRSGPTGHGGAKQA